MSDQRRPQISDLAYLVMQNEAKRQYDRKCAAKNRKLSAEDRAEILTSSRSVPYLAAKFGVSLSWIYQLRIRQNEKGRPRERP